METSGPKGMTAKAAKAVVAESAGAIQYTALCTFAGIISSFRANLMPSMRDCNSPKGPVRFGPIRICIRATTRRSAQMVKRTKTTRMTKTPRVLMQTSQKGSLPNADSSGIKNHLSQAAPYRPVGPQGSPIPASRVNSAATRRHCRPFRSPQPAK